MLTALFKASAHFPLWLLRLIGAVLGWLTYAASPSYARRLRANWAGAAAHLGLDPSGWKAAVSSSGLLVSELPQIWCRPGLAASVPVEGLDAMKALFAQGRGVVFMTPHLGAFELAPRVIAQFFPITVLYRPSKQAVVETVLQALRPNPNIHTLPANAQGVRGLLRVLKQGGAVGMLPDQVPTEGDGVWAPFMGRPANTMTLLIRLAQSTGAPIVSVAALRRPGGWTVSFQPWGPEGRAYQDHADMASAAAGLNREIERLIAQAPEQFLWSYNRFKGQPSQPSQGQTQ